MNKELDRKKKLKSKLEITGYMRYVTKYAALVFKAEKELNKEENSFVTRQDFLANFDRFLLENDARIKTLDHRHTEWINYEVFYAVIAQEEITEAELSFFEDSLGIDVSVLTIGSMYFRFLLKFFLTSRSNPYMFSNLRFKGIDLDVLRE